MNIGWGSVRRGGLVVAVTLGVAVLGVYWVQRGDPWPVRTLVPQELVQSIVATATVQSQHRANVGVQMAGRVVAVHVMEGDRIRPGQSLLRLDDQEVRAAALAAELAVHQAELKWQSWRDVQAPMAHEAARQSQANLIQAQAQLERQQDLFRQGYVGQAALDETVRAFRVAQAQARSATSQDLGHAPGGLEEQLARSALQLAQSNWAAAKARLAYTDVLAAFPGHVVSRAVEPGDTVQPGKTLLVLAPEGVTELVAQIDERNLALLRIGQPAVASADAYPHQPFAAVVNRIAPGVDAQRGSVQVKLTVDHPPDFLRQDMTISVEIEVLRKPAVLSLPVEAVHDIESPQPWVWQVEAGDRLTRTTVELGIRAGARVEVTAGLSAGARVLSVGATGLTAGQRIRVAQSG